MKTPIEWIKSVQGKYQVQYFKDDGATLNDLVTYMEWYAEYACRKQKEQKQ